MSRDTQHNSTPRLRELVRPFQAPRSGVSLRHMRTPRNRKDRRRGYLDGQLLVAMPLMTDKRFARSVIYMCAHSAEGAMGLIINQRAPHISFRELLEQLSIATREPTTIARRPDRRQMCMSAGRSKPGAASCCTAPTITRPISTLRDRRRRLAHGDRRHPQGHRRRQGPRPGDPGARLCRLARRPARERDCRQRLAALPGRPRPAVRSRPRAEIRAGDVQDRHRPLASRERGRPRLSAQALARELFRKTC